VDPYGAQLGSSAVNTACQKDGPCSRVVCIGVREHDSVLSFIVGGLCWQVLTSIVSVCVECRIDDDDDDDDDDD